MTFDAPLLLLLAPVLGLAVGLGAWTLGRSIGNALETRE